MTDLGSQKWYYADDAGRQGPVSLDELRRLVLLGKLKTDGLVWTKGMPDWQPASTVGGLFPAAIQESDVPVRHDDPASRVISREAVKSAVGPLGPNMPAPREQTKVNESPVTAPKARSKTFLFAGAGVALFALLLATGFYFWPKRIGAPISVASAGAGSPAFRTQHEATPERATPAAESAPSHRESSAAPQSKSAPTPESLTPTQQYAASESHLEPASKATSELAADNCEGDAPSAETPEETALLANGGRHLTGKRTRAGAHGEFYVVEAALGYDGQCRPDPYQIYVFYNGKQVGTLAKAPMHPRSDGAITDFKQIDAEHLQLRVEHYRPTDPACCASSHEEKVISLSQFVSLSPLTAAEPTQQAQSDSRPSAQSFRTPPSFDCGRASTATERAICASPELSNLDAELGRAFSDLVATAPASRLRDLRSEQAVWIKERDATCKGDETCLGRYLRERSAALKEIKASGLSAATGSTALPDTYQASRQVSATSPRSPAPQPEVTTAPAVAVNSISFGRSASANGEIRQPDTEFGDKDTIYASIKASIQSTTAQSLDVVWTNSTGTVLHRDRATLSSGPHSLLFNYSDYRGLPAGQYSLGVYVDGKLASSNSFDIAPSRIDKIKAGLEKLGIKVQVQQH